MKVKIKDYYKCDERRLEDVLDVGQRRFVIPFNQRPWEWKEKHLGVLLDDIQKAMAAFFEPDTSGCLVERAIPTALPHFIGAFVFEEDGGDPDVLKVMDGQQRLTAITMILAAIKERLHSLQMRTSDTVLEDDSRGLRDLIKTRYILAKTTPGDPILPKIELDSVMKELFMATVILPDDEADRASRYSSLTKDQKDLRVQTHLHSCVNYVHDEVASRFCDPGNEHVEYSKLCAAVKVLGECFLTIETTVKDDAFALQVFQGLNAKGVPLSEADKIKNELFIASKPAHHTDIKAKWDDIVRAVPSGDIAQYIRRRHLAIYGMCSKANMYEDVREHEIGASGGAMGAISAWWKERGMYGVVTGETTAPMTAAAREHLRNINEVLGVSLSSVMLLPAATRFLAGKRADFETAVKMCLNYCFRELTIGGVDTPQLESTLAAAGRLLRDGKSNSDVQKFLKKASPDNEFEDAFSRASETNASKQFYILYCIEKQRSGAAGMAPLKHSPKQHVEHIMPKNLSRAKTRLGEWSWARIDPDKHKAYVNRIGNLCILEWDINVHVSNYDFAAKQSGAYPSAAKKHKGKTRKCYADSKLHLVNELSKKKKIKRWSYAKIDERQKSLALEAKKVWEI